VPVSKDYKAIFSLPAKTRENPGKTRLSK